MDHDDNLRENKTKQSSKLPKRRTIKKHKQAAKNKNQKNKKQTTKSPPKFSKDKSTLEKS